MSGHSHDHAGHSHGPGGWRGTDRRALLAAAILTGGYMLAEVAGGLITGSLALLADAGHMLSDSLSLFVALGAVILAARPVSARRTYGYKRAEILAALLNGILLAVVAVWIVVEAVHRLNDPVEVLGGGMLAIALIGLAVNLVAAWILMRSGGESLNVKAALRHVLADLAGSVGVIVAALVILLTGWEAADPVISVVISILIAFSAWTVVKESVDILLEAAPSDLDTEEIGRRMAAIADVVEVHDLHVWQITSGMPMLSAHVLVGPAANCHRACLVTEAMLADEFGIGHTTLQVEHVVSSEPLQVEIGPS
ncbi:MAG: cation diffusion facilitator family transporter [Solirubrobacterales bacterium]|nr:cation diffusion facilitator family transporter [Solirubrobacterales bacterium]